MTARVSTLSIRCPKCYMPKGVLCIDARGWHMTIGHRERTIAARIEASRKRDAARGGGA